jgi:hypothetical protein
VAVVPSPGRYLLVDFVSGLVYPFVKSREARLCENVARNAVLQAGSVQELWVEEREVTYVCGGVELEVLVKVRDLLDLLLLQVEAGDVQVLLQTVLRVALGDDSETTLSGPSEQYLGGGLAVGFRDLGDDGVVEEERGVGGELHVALNERLGTEGRVSCNGNVVLLGQLEQVGLDVVWVVLDLERRRLDSGVCEHVKQQSAGVVGDTDALCQTLLLDSLHCLPCALEAGVAVLDLALTVVEPTRGVPCLGRDVLERNREVDDPEIEVVNAPVSQLLPGDGLNLVVVVERLPKLGDNEKVLALHDALLDGAGNTLAGLDLVAVV